MPKVRLCACEREQVQAGAKVYIKDRLAGDTPSLLTTNSAEASPLYPEPIGDIVYSPLAPIGHHEDPMLKLNEVGEKLLSDSA